MALHKKSNTKQLLSPKILIKSGFIKYQILTKDGLRVTICYTIFLEDIFMSERRFWAIVGSIFATGIGAILIYQNFFFKQDRGYKPEPGDSMPTTPEPAPYVWPDFSKFLNNITPMTEQQFIKYYNEAYNQRGPYYDFEKVDTRFGKTWFPDMTIEVTSNFSDMQYQGIVDVANYYNQIFELAGLPHRFTVKKVNQLSGNAEISFYLQALENRILGQAKNFSSEQVEFGDRKIGIINMNSSMFAQMQDGQQIYNLYRRVVLHEMAHSLGIGHFGNAPASVMAGITPTQLSAYWKFTPNDIRAITGLWNHAKTTEEMLKRDAFALQAAQEYYKTNLYYYNTEAKQSVPSTDHVTYYTFDLGAKGGEYCDRLNITLNQSCNGCYTTQIIKNGKIMTTFEGRFYMFNEPTTDGKTKQTIFLESFITPLGFSMETTAIFNGKKSPEITIGDKYLSRLSNVAGGAYASAAERDASIEQSATAMQNIIRTPNMTIVLPKPDEITHLTKKEKVL